MLMYTKEARVVVIYVKGYQCPVVEAEFTNTGSLCLTPIATGINGSFPLLRYRRIEMGL